MGVRLVRIKVRHPCLYSRLIGRVAAAYGVHPAHAHSPPILEVHAPTTDGFRALRESFAAEGGELLMSAKDDNAFLMRFPRCDCCASGGVVERVERGGATLISPVLIGPQEEAYQFVSADGDGVAEALGTLGEKLEVRSADTKPLSFLGLHGRFLVPLGALLGAVSDRQREAIVAAASQGYYRSPRQVSTADLARQFGISRQRYETLLHRAEQNIAEVLWPYLQATPGRTDPDVLRRGIPPLRPPDGGREE